MAARSALTLLVVRVRVGDVRLFFDVEGAGLAVDGPAMRERPALVLLPGGPGFDHTVFSSRTGARPVSENRPPVLRYSSRWTRTPARPVRS